MAGSAAAGNARDPRVRQMINDPNTYFAKAREKARKEAEAAFRREAELRKRKAR